MPASFWSVPREWPDSTVFILGGGPSLAQVDVSKLRNPIIAVNNSWELHPDASCLYFCDRPWWERKTPKLPRFAGYESNGAAVRAEFKGQYVISIAEFADPVVKRLRNTGATGLEADPGGVRHGSNSVYQAINVAYHFGARRIVLLGVDMKVEGDQTHWHAGHGNPARIISHRLETMRKRMAALVAPLADAGVEVLNANPDSALDCWPRIPIEQVC